MDICTWWWLCKRLKYQARKTSRLTVRWPIISMPLPEGPGIAVGVDCFSLFRSRLEVILTSCSSLIVFSLRADMFAVTAAQCTAEGMANVLVNQYIPLWECPRSILSDTKKSPRTTSLNTTFRLLFKDWKWRRSPDTNRFAVEEGSSR